MKPTLLEYSLTKQVRAFSTTRLSPFELSENELLEMGRYAAFNVTHYCGDNNERITRNREWLCNELGIPGNSLWLPRQTHTNRVKCIDHHFMALTNEQQQTQLNEVDALITDIPGQCIGISTADCVPILLFDTQQRVAAAIHAGWKGTVSHITQLTVQQMKKCYQSQPENILAVIGPSISPAAFEVGNEVVEAFLKAEFPPSVVQHGYTKPHIDLWAANAWMLEEEGIPLQHIQISGVCTYTQCDTFFSARRLGINSGRIFTGICIA